MNLSISLSDSALKIGDVSTVIFTFSEAVQWDPIVDTNIPNGYMTTLVTSDYTTWTATFVPGYDVTDTSNFISVDLSDVLDASSNPGSGTVTSDNYTVDTKAPTVGIVMDRTQLNADQTAIVTFTFSEAVSNFTTSDVYSENGLLSDMTTGDNGVTWTATYTPNNVRDTTNTLILFSGRVSDGAGNPNVTAQSANFSIDAVRPTASVVVDNVSLCTVPGHTDSLVRIIFSEAVTGLGIEDLTTPNGTLSNLTTSDNITWTATLTPIAGRTDSSNVITLDTSGVTNAAGSAGAGVTTSNNYEVDVVTPTAVVEVDNVHIGINGTAQVKMTFSEPIVFADINQSLSAENGTISNFTNNDGGITWYATLTPTAGVTADTNKVTLNLAQLMDFSSNFGVGLVESNNYAVDAERPSAVITMDSSALHAGQSTDVTITFSEAVTDFDNADLSINEGTLTNVVTSDNGVTWTATYTPTAGISSPVNAISLTASSYKDAAGNTGGGATSLNYTIQTVRPHATIDVDDDALKAGETTTVTITFTEAVSGFDNADLTVANGTLSTVVTNDGGMTWTATLTPNANVTDTSNLITLTNSGVTNTAGNAGSGTTDSNNYEIDTVAPTAAITLSSHTLAIGGTSLVTFTFSEAVTGLDATDLTVSKGTLSTPVTADGGITWTATFTATAAINSESVIVTLNKTGVADGAGNAGVGNVSSTTIAIPADPVDPVTPGTVTTVDGVAVNTRTSIDPKTGLINTIVTVAPVTSVADGPNSAHPGLADIPLTVGSGAGAVNLVVSLPVGVGIEATGPDALLNHTQALLDVISRIQGSSSGGTQQDMSTLGGDFLDALPAGTLLATKTLVLQLAPGATPGQPIIISGGEAGGNAVGLIIDATRLPAGTIIQLDNVDFAAVTGPVTLRGGLGQNTVVGDDSIQNILLGPDDDVLYGGGGDDIVGSAGGNDRIDGGAGNDIVFGGIGNDTLGGGAGNDVIQGGRGDQGKWTFYLDAQGHVGAQHQTLLADPDATETVALAELNANVANLSFAGASAAALSNMAALYHAAFGRVPDLDGFNYWIGSGVSLRQAAHDFATSAEFLKGAGALDHMTLVRTVYANALGLEGASNFTAEQAGWVTKLNAATDPASVRADMLLALTQNTLTKTHWMAADGSTAIATETLATGHGWILGSGDDVLEGGAGNDLLVGGDGIDTVVYAGKLADYDIVLDAKGGITVREAKAGGDIDTLLQIEKGQFSDGTVDLGFTNSSAASLQQIGMLYQTVLNRSADLPGLLFWDANDNSALALAQNFIGSSEFQGRYGTMDNSTFVAVLANNVLNRAQDAVSAQSWITYLDTHSRAEMVVALTGSADALAAQYAGGGLVLI